MITYKKTIEDFEDLKKMCWGGALDRIHEIEDYDMQEVFFEYVNECLEGFVDFKDIDINDFIWFDCDEWIEENIYKEENNK